MNAKFLYDVFDTRIGRLTAVVDREGHVTEVWTFDAQERLSGSSDYAVDRRAVEPVRQQLIEYAAGKRRKFDVRLAPLGSPFQRRVWKELEKIPFGETRSYGEIARALGVPNASRAVGGANGSNPISIIVPCHRVIGSSGALTGYGGGLEMKRRLLELEGTQTPGLF